MNNLNDKKLDAIEIEKVSGGANEHVLNDIVENSYCPNCKRITPIAGKNKVTRVGVAGVHRKCNEMKCSCCGKNTDWIITDEHGIRLKDSPGWGFYGSYYNVYFDDSGNLHSYNYDTNKDYVVYEITN